MPKRAVPGEKALVVQKLRPKYSLSLLMESAHLPRATFYYQVKRMQKADKYAGAKEEIHAIYHIFLPLWICTMVIWSAAPSQTDRF